MKLDQRAVDRVSGPSWEAMRPAVLKLADALLSPSEKATNQLTTIYVKFERPAGSVYAVMWVKKSTQVVVGLALPAGMNSPRFHAPPSTMKYPGLTAYFSVTSPEDVPAEVGAWAQAAFAAL